MTLRHKLLILFVLISLVDKSQDLKDDKGVPWKFEYHPQHPSQGLVYQNELLYQLGQRFGFRKKRELLSLCILAQVQVRKVIYLSPTAVLSYYKPIKKMYGPIFNLEYSYRKINGLTCNTLTPEIGLALPWYYSINVGYNIKIDNSFEWTTPFRITLRAIGP